MKQFYELLAKHGYPIPTDGESTFIILSSTSTTEGYLLVTRRAWVDGSIREDAWLIIDDQYGPNKSSLRVGWSHKILETYVEEKEEEETVMRDWGPEHPEYKADADLGTAPTDWDGTEVVFYDGRPYPDHLKGRAFVVWDWSVTGRDGAIVSYSSKKTKAQ